MCKVAKLIDDRLNELGIKGSKMCDDLGISRSTLTELRKGRSKFLLPQTANLIGKYLGLDPLQLMGVENQLPDEDQPIGDLYNRIESLCKIKGERMSDLCRSIGIRSGVMSDLKMGRSKSLSSATLSKIAGHFGVSVDYLLGVSGKGTEEDNELAELLEEIRRNPDLRTMFSLTKNATPEEVRQYIKVIKAIRGEE